MSGVPSSRTASNTARVSAARANAPRAPRRAARSSHQPASNDLSTLAPVAALSQERREFLCSVIGLTVKCSLALLAGVSLVRLAGAYQERMERHGELAAVLDLEQAKLARARDRFDRLFGMDGEQRLIREQNQWIAPNRLRVVWKNGAE